MTEVYLRFLCAHYLERAPERRAVTAASSTAAAVSAIVASFPALLVLLSAAPPAAGGVGLICALTVACSCSAAATAALLRLRSRPAGCCCEEAVAGEAPVPCSRWRSKALSSSCDCSDLPAMHPHPQYSVETCRAGCEARGSPMPCICATALCARRSGAVKLLGTVCSNYGCVSIIRNARIENVGNAQSCVVSTLPSLSKQTVPARRK